MTPEPADPVGAGGVARRFRLLSDPTRVQILRLLADTPAPLAVGEVAAAVGVAHSTASHHLQRLATAGVVHIRRVGRLGLVTLDREAARRPPLPLVLGGDAVAASDADRRGPS